MPVSPARAFFAVMLTVNTMSIFIRTVTLFCPTLPVNRPCLPAGTSNCSIVEETWVTHPNVKVLSGLISRQRCPHSSCCSDTSDLTHGLLWGTACSNVNNNSQNSLTSRFFIALTGLMSYFRNIALFPDVTARLDLPVVLTKVLTWCNDEMMPLIADQVTGDANCGTNEKKQEVGAPSVGDWTGSPHVSGTLLAARSLDFFFFF